MMPSAGRDTDVQRALAEFDRLLAARKLQLTEVPVIVLDHLTDAQKRAYVIADNQLALNAGWDEALLEAAVVTAITSITLIVRISKLILPAPNWARKSGSRLDGIVGGISDDRAWHKIRAQERRDNLSKFDQLRIKTEIQLIQLINAELDLGIRDARQALKSADLWAAAEECYRRANRACPAWSLRLAATLSASPRHVSYAVLPDLPARLGRVAVLVEPRHERKD